MRPVMLLLVGVVTIILGFATYKVAVLRADLEDLKRTNAALIEELRRREKSAVTALEDETPRDNSEITQEEKLGSSDLSYTSVQQIDATPSAGGLAWRVSQSIKQMEEFVALSPEQREKATRRLTEFYEGGTKRGREQEYARVLEESLGEELFAQYEEKRVQKSERDFQQKVKDESIILGKKLGLTSDQEERMRAALELVERSMNSERAELEGRMGEAMANHFEGDAGKEKLKLQFEEINQITRDMKKRKDSALFAETAQFLSDEQRNALLELQAAD